MYVVYKKRSALVVLTSSRATIVLSAPLPRHGTTASRSRWLPTWRAAAPLLVSVRQTWSHSADSRQSLYIDDHQRLWPHLSGNTPQPGYAR